MTPLERYLKAATRGLWGKRKLEVREELAAHVSERIRKHELLGLTREEAMAKTLEQMGNPKQLSTAFLEAQMKRTQWLAGLITLAFLGFGTQRLNNELHPPRVFGFICQNQTRTLKVEGKLHSTWLEHPDLKSLALAINGIGLASITSQNVSIRFAEIGNALRLVELEGRVQLGEFSKELKSLTMTIHDGIKTKSSVDCQPS